MAVVPVATVRPHDGTMRSRAVSDLDGMATTADLRTLGSPWPRYTSGAGSAAPGLALVGVLVAAAFGVHRLVPQISPLVAAVALGALAANVGTVPTWAVDGVQFAAKRLLRFGIVLLGLQLSLGDVLALGAPGLAVVAAVVGVTFLGTRWAGRRLGVSPSLSLLIATGFSICGASAIAAMDGVSDADEDELAFSIVLVTLCGSAAIVVLPAISGPLGLTGARFGSWVGASVHDVGQVVATASGAGAVALRAAIVVKLTRVVLLAPLVAGVTIARRRSTPTGLPTGVAGRRPPLLPAFVIGFVVAIVIRSTGAVPAAALDVAGSIEQVALAAALVGLGTGVRFARFRRIGGRPLLLALVSWVLVAGVAYVGVVVTGV